MGTTVTAWFVLPIATTSVQSVVPYPLLTPPYSDTTLFPKGFPPNAHPVLVSSGYDNDIRMASLQIPALKSASIYVPYTDRLGDGKTAFNYVSVSIASLAAQVLQSLLLVRRRFLKPFFIKPTHDLLIVEAGFQLHRRRGWRRWPERHLFPASCRAL